MRILIVNDDGIHATGLDVLASAARSFGDVWTVAPHVECSAMSNAITLHSPLRIYPRGHQRWAITGTPTDCTYVALHHFGVTFDLVLSGVNHGPNLGIDVLYSGTVAAAMEATRAGIPAFAFSLVQGHSEPVDSEQWCSVGRVVKDVLTWYTQSKPMPEGTLLNVNIPGGEIASPTPLTGTTLGQVSYPPRVTEQLDPRGKPFLWIGGDPPTLGNQPGTDCAAIHNQSISITPLQLNLTNYDQVDALHQEITAFLREKP